jgi:hypothetical protein
LNIKEHIFRSGSCESRPSLSKRIFSGLDLVKVGPVYQREYFPARIL